jgi:hypothetical protein
MPHFPGLAILRSARRRARRFLRPACVCLEPRALPGSINGLSLSAVFQGPPALFPKTVSITFPPGLNGRTNALYQMSMTHHPLYQSIENGHVSKVPLFLPGYTGAKLTDLDVDGAIARLTPSKEFHLRGTVLGPINLADPLVYSFLINRGGATTPGPIAVRPGITANAVVSVRIGLPIGHPTPLGTVSLLNQQGQVTSVVTLPSSDVQVVGTSVSVELPASLLPRTSSATSRLSPTGYSFAFESAVIGGQQSEIAGVAPEFFDAPVGT